jgi:hypothetical protein
MQLEGLSIKNPNDSIGYRTRDLPACGTVPQPTAPPRGWNVDRVMGILTGGGGGFVVLHSFTRQIP